MVPPVAPAQTQQTQQPQPHRGGRKMHPNEGGSALPGEGGSALPGSQLLCALTLQPGQASCTIAINVNILSIADTLLPASLIPGMHPSDIRSAYNIPPGGSGHTVAIVDAYDDATAELDLGVYRSKYGMSACGSLNGCFRKVNQHGGGLLMPLPNVAWAQEESLDIEMVSAACPNCKILLVEANSASLDDLGAAEDTAVALGAKVVSNSYYAAEWSGETAYDVHFNHPGVAITASSGDAPYPFYPAASPYVTAIGGTSISGGPGSWSETPWAYAGTGCSAYEPQPSYQSGVSACSTRSTVDMATVADPQTGVSAFATLSGGWVVVGGTSVGAPLVAGAYALAGNGAGPGHSYANPSAFRDVAPAGYDPLTGLGTPQGTGGL